MDHPGRTRGNSDHLGARRPPRAWQHSGHEKGNLPVRFVKSHREQIKFLLTFERLS